MNSGRLATLAQPLPSSSRSLSRRSARRRGINDFIIVAAFIRNAYTCTGIPSSSSPAFYDFPAVTKVAASVIIILLTIAYIQLHHTLCGLD